MPSDQFDEAEVAAFFGRDKNTDRYYSITSIPHDRAPREALRCALALAEMAPDDDALCWLGVALLEPIVELHWRALGEARAAPAR